MKPEIELLVSNFRDQVWSANTDLQEAFYRVLSDQDFFEGTVSGNLAFKARDRITRAPKALGFVNLEPVISITPAGNEYIHGEFPEEAFTRQLLKFQFPSPYHIDNKGDFFVKPYLELLRLVYDLDGISKDEIAIFFMQLKNYNLYPNIKNLIEEFRNDIKEIDRTQSNYLRLVDQVFTREIRKLYAAELERGDIRTRESRVRSSGNFIRTKKRNHKDYADAAIRYLRETKLVVLNSYRSTRIVIPENSKPDVEFLLNTINRDPIYIEDKKNYKNLLFDSTLPEIHSDNKEALMNTILVYSNSYSKANLTTNDIPSLKLLRQSLIRDYQNSSIKLITKDLETYRLFGEIVETFNNIKKREIIDAPAFMEWNTWRAFVMLDDGVIEGNFKFDNEGFPLSTASGNMPDLVCQYRDFDMIVEVTLSSGVQQHTMEGESVPRHLGKHIQEYDKETFCMFIALNLNEATIAHFFGLHKIHIEYYGGKSKIIPLSLQDFINLLDYAYHNDVKPTANDIRNFLEDTSAKVLKSKNEREWYRLIQESVQSWY